MALAEPGRLLINAGLCALAVNTSVVLDFGFWGRDERSALRSLGASVGAAVEVVYMPVKVVSRLRIGLRHTTAPPLSWSSRGRPLAACVSVGGGGGLTRSSSIARGPAVNIEE